MRCKCGFNSFDHNLVCPKCHKDLTVTRGLLNMEIPAPGGVNFFQIVGQKIAGPPLPIFDDPAEEPIEIEVTDLIEVDQPGNLPWMKTALTPVDTRPENQIFAPKGGGEDDLSSLVDGMNLDILEVDL